MVKTNLFLLPLQCNIQLNRKMMSELAIHEPRSFKVCQQYYYAERKEVRKGAKNERGRQGGVGIQSEESMGGARKQAGL